MIDTTDMLHNKFLFLLVFKQMDFFGFSVSFFGRKATRNIIDTSARWAIVSRETFSMQIFAEKKIEDKFFP